eukprot:5601899-Pyramimonas_sp.AAC.1
MRAAPLPTPFRSLPNSPTAGPLQGPPGAAHAAGAAVAVASWWAGAELAVPCAPGGGGAGPAQVRGPLRTPSGAPPDPL